MCSVYHKCVCTSCVDLPCSISPSSLLPPSLLPPFFFPPPPPSCLQPEDSVWYHEGPVELEQARLWITQYSIPRAVSRLELARMDRAQPSAERAAKRQDTHKQLRVGHTHTHTHIHTAQHTHTPGCMQSIVLVCIQ